jgi:hypothetical protein
MVKVSRALAVVVSLSHVACATTFDFTPVPSAPMREAVRTATAGGHATVRDEGGTVHDVDPSTGIAYADSAAELPGAEHDEPPTPKDIASLCKDPSSAVCPLTKASTVWAVGTPHTVVLWGSVLGVGLPVVLLGGVIAGNAACVAGDQCADGVKTTVIVVDIALAALVVAGLAAVFVMAKNFEHFGD